MNHNQLETATGLTDILTLEDICIAAGAKQVTQEGLKLAIAKSKCIIMVTMSTADLIATHMKAEGRRTSTPMFIY